MNTVTCKITDAVNEFKGEWECGTALIYKSKVTKDLVFSNFIPLKKQASRGYVCSRESFKSLAFDMTVNYGESSLKHLEIWQEGLKRQAETDKQHADKLNEMDKELDVMDIDYKYNGKTNTFFTNGRIYKVSIEGFEHITKDDTNDAQHELSDDYLSKNFSKVFTQAMADNGELPLVGMECMVVDSSLMNHEYEKCVILFVGIYKVVYTSESCVERFSNLDEVIFKPIDTRTDKEKAIDDMVEHLTNEGVVTQSNFMLELFVEKFIGCKIHGVKWVGE